MAPVRNQMSCVLGRAARERLSFRTGGIGLLTKVLLYQWLCVQALHEGCELFPKWFAILRHFNHLVDRSHFGVHAFAYHCPDPVPPGRDLNVHL
jgi:hypothetical protein